MKNGIARRQVLDPAHERRLAHLHALEQHPVEREEERDLYQHRQAAGDRVDLLALVELHHRPRLALAVVLVALLNSLQPRRDCLHLRHRAAARLRELVEHQLDQERDDDDRPAPVADVLVDLREQPEQRLRQDRQHAVVGSELEPRARTLQLFLQLRPDEQRLGEVQVATRGDRRAPARSRAAGNPCRRPAARTGRPAPAGGTRGGDEVVLHRGQPAARHRARERGVFLVLDVELLVLLAVEVRGPPERISLRIPHRALVAGRMAQELRVRRELDRLSARVLDAVVDARPGKSRGARRSAWSP